MNLGSTRRHASRVGVRAIFALAVVSMSGASALALPLHYFVVAENPSLVDPCLRCDSYILPLSDPDDIARARTLIEGGGGGSDTAITAKIRAGTDRINRDVLAPGEPLWSWHVTEFVGFGSGGTPEDFMGWPSLVESDVDGWIARYADIPGIEEGVGYIAFPYFTVVAEIPEPGSLALLAAGCWLLVCLRRRPRRSRRCTAIVIHTPEETSRC